MDGRAPEVGDGGLTPGSVSAELERLRVGALVKLQLVVSRYRKGLAEASGRATPKESLILRDLEVRGLDAEAFRVMLHGGHVVIDDPELYERWTFPDSVERLSSHHKDVDKKQFPDYGMVGPLVRQSLHGRTAQGTWIQWERTPAAFKFGRRIRWTDVVHIKDYVVYRITRKNVGPWGLSDATEKRPLYLSPRVAVSRPLPPEVAAGVVTALQATRGADRVWLDPVRELFQPPPLTRLVGAAWEDGARRTGAIGGLPITRHRVAAPYLATSGASRAATSDPSSTTETGDT